MNIKPNIITLQG